MDGVKRYGHISYLVEASPQMLKLYPEMTVYVLASDFDAALAREASLEMSIQELAGANAELVQKCNALDKSEAALREDLAKYKDGFFQKVTDEDLKKISDFVGDGDLPTNSFFMRADAGNLANMTMHMVREVQSLRIGLAAAEQRNAELVELLQRTYDADLAARHCQPYNTSKLMDDIEAALKPTESRASDKCLSDGGTCGLGGHCGECPHVESGESE